MSTTNHLQNLLTGFVFAKLRNRPLGSATKDMNLYDCRLVLRHLRKHIPGIAFVLGMTIGPPEHYFWYDEVVSAIKGRMKGIDE